jgi:hypothetical protein
LIKAAQASQKTVEKCTANSPFTFSADKVVRGTTVSPLKTTSAFWGESAESSPQTPVDYGIE